MEEKKRSQFSGSMGFVLAAAGSAVGLGNLWRFPYLAAKYGGAAFILVYVLLVITFGYTLMMTEIAIGRKTKLSPIGAYQKIQKNSSLVGVIAVVVAALITPYYSVIGGWVIKYITLFFSGDGVTAATDGFFGGYIGSTTQPLIFQAVFIMLAIIIIIGGVKNGIEKMNKILMPILLVLSLFIAGYSLTLPGAIDGLKYLLIPDLSNFSIAGVVAAMGQMFYSMSLAMGVMITYGSYMRKEENIEKCVGHIELFDTGIAILATLMIVPAVFSFSGGDPASLGQGPGLMFVSLPQVFQTMPLGNVIGAVFFILVLFAAITSVVSLMEVVISTIGDKFKVKRKISILIVGVFSLVISIAPTLGYSIWSNVRIIGLDILDFMDFLTNYVMMPIGALLTCIIVGYIVKPDFVIAEIESSGEFKRKGIYKIILKYIAPIFTIIVLVAQFLQTYGFIKF